MRQSSPGVKAAAAVLVVALGMVGHGDRSTTPVVGALGGVAVGVRRASALEPSADGEHVAYMPSVTMQDQVPSRRMGFDLVGQLGGGSDGIDVANGRAFRGEGPHLVVYDLSDPDAIEVLGKSDYLAGHVMGVDVSGSTAFVAAETGGLASVDVSDPGRPRLLARAATPSRATDVVVLDDMAVVAVPGHGLIVYDVAAPESLPEVARLDLPVKFLTLAGGDGYVLVGPWGVLHVVDLHEPSAPTIAAELPGAMAVAVSGDHAYVVSEPCALDIYDMSDIRAPRLVSSTLAPPETCQVDLLLTAGVAVADDRLLLHMAGHLLAWDVADPAAPRLTGVAAHPCITTDSALDGSLLVANCAIGAFDEIVYGPLAVLDVGDMTAPGLLAEHWAGSADTVDAQAVGSYLYAAMSVPQPGPDAATITRVRRTALVDPSDPARPRLIRFLDDLQGVTDLTVQGTAGVVTTESGTLATYDLTDPAEPRRLGSLLVHGTDHRMAQSGTTVGVLSSHGCPAGDGTCGGTVALVDVADPTAPRLAGRVPLPVTPGQVVARDGYLYVVGPRADEDGSHPDATSLLAIDARDLDRPTLAGETAVEGATAIATHKDRLIVGTRRGRLLSLDLDDPAAPAPAARPLAYGQSDVSSLAIWNDYAFVGYASSSGLLVHDLVNPLYSELAGAYRATPYGMWGDSMLDAVRVAGVQRDHLFLGADTGGHRALQVLRIRWP